MTARGKGSALAWLLRKAVELACTALGVYLLAALAALNILAVLAGVLALNALLGLWFALDNKKSRPGCANIQNGQVKRNSCPVSPAF